MKSRYHRWEMGLRGIYPGIPVPSTDKTKPTTALTYTFLFKLFKKFAK